VFAVNKKRNVFLIVSLALNFLLIIACAFLFYKSGYAGAVKNAMFPSYFVRMPEDNPQYGMRNSLFEIVPPSETDIVFLGDSITQRCEWGELLQGYSVKNRGIGSDTTLGVLNRLDSIIEMNPKMIFLMIGINDLSTDSVENLTQRYDEIVNKIKTNLPDCSVYLQSILPVGKPRGDIKEANAAIELIANRYGYTYMDLYSLMSDSNGKLKAEFTKDGTHLMGEAYKVWADEIMKILP